MNKPGSQFSLINQNSKYVTQKKKMFYFVSKYLNIILSQLIKYIFYTNYADTNVYNNNFFFKY